MLAWSQSDDLWLRRSAIIGQVGLKGKADLELLDACIRPALDSKEFFLRKAIGWALRDHAWSDPSWRAARCFCPKVRPSPSLSA